MELQVANNGGGLKVSPDLFETEFNEALVHQVVTAYMAGARAGTKGQKNRAAVSGGGRKPWRQKGTGRARAGTIRSPIWRGGGKTFAAVNRDFSQKVNRKMYRAGMRSIVAELLRQERLVVVKDFATTEPKTKSLVAELASLNASQALLVTAEANDNLSLAARNIPYVDVCAIGEINPLDLVAHEKVVMTVDAVKKIEEMLA
ncbi:MAG: 50S ribosomal protein L4 [Nevskiales bacterium]